MRRWNGCGAGCERCCADVYDAAIFIGAMTVDMRVKIA